MEKLIKLLNEYEAKRHKTSVIAEIRWQNGDKLTYLGLNSHYSELLCISKGYLFIDWLLKEDKIDLWKIAKLYRKSNENSTATYPILYDYTYDESLLMFLAIQDNPIDFLISVLK